MHSDSTRSTNEIMISFIYLDTAGPTNIHGLVSHFSDELHDEILQEVNGLGVRVLVISVPVQHTPQFLYTSKLKRVVRLRQREEEIERESKGASQRERKERGIERREIQEKERDKREGERQKRKREPRERESAREKGCG